MTIDSFAEYLITHIKANLPNEYHDVTFTVMHRTQPGNLPFTGISIRKATMDTSPCFGIDGLYTQYIQGIDLATLADSFVKYVMEFNPLPHFQKEWITDFGKAKDYIVSRLIDIRPAHNDEYLKGRPVKRLGNTDIGIIYELDISQFVGRTGPAIPVTDKMMEFWDNPALDTISEQADKNTPRLRPAKMSLLSDICKKQADNNTEVSTNDSNELTKYTLVLTNVSAHYGANVILYPEIQKTLGNRFPNGYYVLPFSVHSTMIVPQGMASPQQLLNMMTHLNKTEIRIDQRLGDDVFILKNGILASALC